jgi:hypothetical protein
VNSELQRLEQAEREAWNALTSYIDFADKCKKRVYKEQKPYSPMPVPDVEAEFIKLNQRWQEAKIRLQEYRATSPARNASPPAVSGSRTHPSNTSPTA